MFNWLFRNSAKSFLCLSHFTWGIKWKLETLTSTRNGSLQSWTHQLELLWRNLCHQDFPNLPMDCIKPSQACALDSHQRPDSASFPLLGELGTAPGAPSFSSSTGSPKCPSRNPTALAGPSSRTEFVAAVRGGRTKPQSYVTPPRQQPGQNPGFPRGANFALWELAEMNTGSNPEDKTKALQNHAHHPPTGYPTAGFFPER